MSRVAEHEVPSVPVAQSAESMGPHWWEWRLDADRVELSPELAGRLGLSGTETSALMLSRTYVHPDDRLAIARALKRVRDGEAALFDAELRLMTRTGPAWVCARGKPVHDAAGRIERVVGTSRDLADRPGSGDALARERADSRKWAMIAERTDDGVVVTDSQGRVEWVNSAFEGISGYTLTEFLGRAPSDLLNGPRTDPDVLADLAAAIADRRAVRVELLSYRKSGNPFWEKVDLQPVVDENGSVTQFIYLRQDLTDRKRAACLRVARTASLNQQSRRVDLPSTVADMAAALEAGCIDATLAVFVLDASGDKLRCLAGPSLPDEVRSLLETVPLGEAGGVLGRVGRGTRACSAALTDDPILARIAEVGGGAGLVDCWAEPMVGFDGIQQGVLALFSGGSRRVDAAETGFVEQAAYTIANLIEHDSRAQALARSERHFQNLAEVLPIYVSYVDRHHNFRYTNAAHDACLGVPRGSLIGQPVRSIFSEDSWLTVQERLDRAFRGERVSCTSLRIYREDVQRYVHATYVPDFDADGEVAGIYGIIEDITEFQRREDELRFAKEQAQASSAAKSLFLANMSHELRTPLNAIMGYSELIRSEVLGPLGNDQYHIYLDDIHASGRHLLDLIENVLNLSKLDAGEHELVQERVALAEVIEQSLAALEIADDPRITRDLPAQVVLSGDRGACRQVLVNLISNAVKHAGDGPIRITARPDGQDWLISVVDSGPGIPADDVPRITEPFYRVDQQQWVATERESGTGIGLALAKRLMEEMGGVMVIDSAVGVGTTVTLRLPGTA